MTISIADVDCYELNGNYYVVYGFEYKPRFVEAKCAFFSFLPPLELRPVLSNHRPTQSRGTSPGSTITKLRGR